jgi:Opioid growth factor receptor (OGFr) conserved region
VPAILGFLSGEQPDDQGRFLREIQQWPDQRIEAVHDFIQWMFPLAEPSPVNPEAPVLDGAVLAELRARPELRARVQEGARASLDRMRRFYERSRHWVTPGNHNHLRVTRILKCLRLLGLEAEAAEFFAWLSEVYEAERKKPRPGISERSFEFWRQAAGA